MELIRKTILLGYRISASLRKKFGYRIPRESII